MLVFYCNNAILIRKIILHHRVRWVRRVREGESRSRYIPSAGELNVTETENLFPHCSNIDFGHCIRPCLSQCALFPADCGCNFYYENCPISEQFSATATELKIFSCIVGLIEDSTVTRRNSLLL